MTDHEASHSANKTTLLELTGRKSDYRFERRARILRENRLASFIGTSHPEVNDAFGYLFDLATKGQTTDEKLAIIGEHVRNKAPADETEVRAIRAITRVTSNRFAYAAQAQYDKNRLRLFSDQVAQAIQAGEHYFSLAEFVGVTGTPAYEGPGQLARYIDAARFLLDKPEVDGRFTFTGQFGRDSANHSVVRDAFTAPALAPVMEQYQREVLGEVPMDHAVAILGYAAYNEVKRERFWELDLHAASRDAIARPVAAAALRALSA
jgi:hypothetical protein